MLRQVATRIITKATRKPRRGKWPPDPARVRSIVDGLEELYPDVDCELDRESPFQLLCAAGVHLPPWLRQLVYDE